MTIAGNHAAEKRFACILPLCFPVKELALPKHVLFKMQKKLDWKKKKKKKKKDVENDPLIIMIAFSSEIIYVNNE